MMTRLRPWQRLLRRRDPLSRLDTETKRKLCEMNASELLELYSGAQRLAAGCGRRLRPDGPVVQTARGDGQPEAHFHHRIRVGGLRFLGVDVFVFAHYRCSRAK